MLREREWNQSISLFHENFLFIDQDGIISEFCGFDDASKGQYNRVYSPVQLQKRITEEGLCFDSAYGSFELPLKLHGADAQRFLIVGHKT